MPPDLDLNVFATTRALRAALQAAEEICAARAVDARLVARARVVIEELFTNTIKYGYGGESERPVRLRLSVGRALTVTIEDDAPPFDPTLWKSATGALTLPSEKPPGQSGIALVLGLSAKVNYLRLPTGNRVTVILES